MSSNNDVTNALNILARKKFPKLSQTSFSGIVYCILSALTSSYTSEVLLHSDTLHRNLRTLIQVIQEGLVEIQNIHCHSYGQEFSSV